MTEVGTRLPLWRQIHATLQAEIAEGRYRAGERLPSEASLASRFGVNRHTLRRALGMLAEAGQIHLRRGASATVTARPVEYALGPRTRFGANLAAAGQVAGHEYLRLETLRADAQEAEHLGLEAGEPVHVVEGIGLADGVPVTYGIGVFPAARFPDLLKHLPKVRSVTAALARCGLADYERRWTRLAAEIARGTLARHLHCAEGTALLRTVSLNVDPEGRPVEFGRTWFVSERIRFVVDRDSFRKGAPGFAPEGGGFGL
ncbi:MAG TPA: phosphonate metabolism transcriptional regulator PhnF [Paracoccaceae bacterium]|nr:phosphonate metabolism transcriptional regulator PhnF [Paracoccaceae bacterium]